MKKLLYISGSLLPSKFANSVHVTKMCQALAENDVDVTLIGMSGDKKVNVHKYYNVKETFEIKISKSYRSSLLRFINYNLFCFKHIRKNEVIYLRYLYSLIWCMILKKNFIVEFHGLPSNKYIERILRKTFKSKHFLAAVFITESLKEAFVENYNLNVDKCKVFPDCADIPDKLSKNLNANEIGYVGHLYEGRGVELIIELAKSLPDSNFHIIGGHEEDVAKYKAISPENMIYYGFVKQAELQSLYTKFGIALAPYQHKVGIGKKGSDTARWMSPMKIFEYMSYKQAVLLSDLPVLHEIGKHNKELIFCDPENYLDWLGKIQKLQENKDFFNSLRENSHTLFINQYTWSGRAKNILELIE